MLSGKDIWRLYDTYGFPVDLTQIMAEERGLKIDEVAFEKARLESLEASKAGGRTVGGVQIKLDVHDLAALEANDAVPKTDDSFKYRELECWNSGMGSKLISSRARRYQSHCQSHLPRLEVPHQHL